MFLRSVFDKDLALIGQMPIRSQKSRAFAEVEILLTLAFGRPNGRGRLWCLSSAKRHYAAVAHFRCLAK